MPGRDVHEEVVEDRRVHPESDELTEGREAGTRRRIRSEESGTQEREDSEQDERRGAERVEGHHDPAILQPTLHPAEEGRVNSREDQEHRDGGEEGEGLSAFAQGPDEEGFDRAWNPAHHEIDGQRREKYAEPIQTEEARDEEPGASRDRAGAEAMPRQPSEDRPGPFPCRHHAMTTADGSFEPMPALEIGSNSLSILRLVLRGRPCPGPPVPRCASAAASH